MSDCTSDLNVPPVKLYSPKNFKLPKRSLGAQGKDHQSFHAEWCETYPWLLYDTLQDSAFCHVCVTAEFKNIFQAAQKDPAFITTGFTYWKEAVTAFKRHANNACH